MKLKSSEMGKKNNFAYITGILKNMLDLDESEFKESFGRFLKSKYEKSCEDDYDKFLETMTSGPSMTSGDFPDTPEYVNRKDGEDKEKKESLSYKKFF